MEPLGNQSNVLEDDQKTWAVYSVLQMRARKEHHGLSIRCLAEHPTSTIPASSETRLNIQCTYKYCS